ncbi:MAG TPA: 4-(cytidine 5'-diphospho)-2-C-methyl-D-erythritol kinase [Terriglobia bacterium]|nr:4-(cytidine 5'-diphospho)-2-C-methyl-D-erythritol kinase [Terriglobia bacterium]
MLVGFLDLPRLGTAPSYLLTKTVQARAFAKINAGLRVLAKRPDGFHEIRTIYQTVSLADRVDVHISPRHNGISFECDREELGPGRDNLVYRAAKLWQRARGFKGGIRLRLEKRIPVGAGLGGGSSDAAVTLLALERLTGNRLCLSARLELAANLGSDVPLFLLGGRVLGCGRGEEVYPLTDLPARHCLIVFPGFSVSTADAYRELGMRLTEGKEDRRISSLGKRPPFPLEAWGPAENDFERFVFARWPELARVKRQLIRAGAETASLTGSGSALYAVYESAQQLREAATRIPAGWKVFQVRTLTRTAYLKRIFV